MLHDMQRIVLDTNVLVSALISRSYPAMIVEDLVLEEKVEVCISDEVMQEYVEVLRRPKFDRFANFRTNAEILLSHIQEISLHFKPSQKVEVLTDLDDNKFLEVENNSQNLEPFAFSKRFPKKYEMQTLIVKTNQAKTMDLVLELLSQVDGIEIESVVEKSPKEDSKKKGGILSLAGIWKDIDIDANKLREEAWRRTE